MRKPVIIGSVLVGIVLAFTWGLGVGLRQWFPFEVLRSAYESWAPVVEESALVVGPSLDELRSGGLLIHMRHAHRDDAIDVTVADYFARVLGSEEVFAAATCLSDEGREQAELTRLVFADLGIVASRVVTSGSCRANEHARIAFGGITSTDARHLHLTAVPESQKASHVIAEAEALRELFSSGSGLTVVIGHELEPYGCRAVRCLEGVGPREMGGLSVLKMNEGTVIEAARYRHLYDFFMSLG